MNNLDDVLHLWWRRTKNLLYNYNLIYLIIPIIYLLISIFIRDNVIFENEINYQRLSSYTTVLTKEDKIKYILDKYNLSEYEFKVICGIVLSEAEANSYEDAYAVINTIYNRTKSKNWVNSANIRYGKDKGYSLYYQAILPNQFIVYQKGSYLRNINNTTSVGYDAIIDFLYSERIMHNYLSFRANYVYIKGSETFSENGNKYFNPIKESNRI